MGRVIDATSGEPIDGALVSTWRVSGGSNELQQVVTDDAGRFAFVGISPGRYELLAEAPGYLSSRLGQTLPELGGRLYDTSGTENLSDLTLRMWRPGVISGIVMDGQGEPAVGVSVIAWRRVPSTKVLGAFEFVNPATSLATTDDRGAYRIAAPPGEYVVLVPPPMFFSEGTGAAARSVRPELGAFAWQDFYVRLPGSSGLINRPTLTPSVPTGSRPLMTYPPTFYPAAHLPAEGQIVTLLAGGEVSNVNIQLRQVAASAIVGSVTDGAGPAAGVLVRAIPKHASMFSSDRDFDAANAVADSAGRFALVGVPPRRVCRASRAGNDGRRQAASRLAGSRLGRRGADRW